MTGTVDIQELKKRALAAKEARDRRPTDTDLYAIAPGPYSLYIAAASPSTILALIEENERLREALEKIAKGKYGKCPIEGHWPPEKPCTLCGDLGFFDDQPEYDPAKDGHCVEGGARVIARAALKEATDV